MSTSDSDSVDEFKCQSCGQVFICLNSTRSGPEVCYDCLTLFAADETNFCPRGKIPLHVVNQITQLEEDLQRCSCSDKKTIEKFSSMNQRHFDELKDEKTELGRNVREMKIEMLRMSQIDRETRNYLHSEIEALTSKVGHLQKQSSELKKKNDELSNDNNNLKKNLSKENSDLKEKLEKIEKEFEEYRSSVKLNMTDQSLLHLDFFSMNGFNLITESDHFEPTFSWKIKRIKDKMARHTYQECSNWFRWTGYPFKARAKLELYEHGVVCMSLSLEHDSSFEKEKDPKIIPKVYYLLKGQDRPHLLSFAREACPLFPAKFNIGSPFLATLVHKSKLTDPSYNADDSITVEIYVEPPSMAGQAHSSNGLLTYAIEDCFKRRVFEKKELVSYHESPYFYTGPKGYRVQVRLALDGLGNYKGKGASAFIRFLQGEYDDDLPRSFPHRTTITLSSSRHFKFCVVKTVDKCNIDKKSCYQVDICETNWIDCMTQWNTLYVRVKIDKAV